MRRFVVNGKFMCVTFLACLCAPPPPPPSSRALQTLSHDSYLRPPPLPPPSHASSLPCTGFPLPQTPTRHHLHPYLAIYKCHHRPTWHAPQSSLLYAISLHFLLYTSWPHSRISLAYSTIRHNLHLYSFIYHSHHYTTCHDSQFLLEVKAILDFFHQYSSSPWLFFYPGQLLQPLPLHVRHNFHFRLSSVAITTYLSPLSSLFHFLLPLPQTVTTMHLPPRLVSHYYLRRGIITFIFGFACHHGLFLYPGLQLP